AQVQWFLEQKGSFLANYSDEHHDLIGPGVLGDGTCSNPAAGCFDAYGWRASRVIWSAANWYGINPQVILATLQKEQSLVTQPSYPPSYEHWRIDYAMGYGCPDGGSCSYAGFSRQVNRGTWQFNYNMYYANLRDSRVSPYLTGSTVTICDTYPPTYCANVYLGNGATASLYRYTPYFHGNQNFYDIYIRWFYFLIMEPDNTAATVVGVNQDGGSEDELAVFYDYGWANTGLFVFDPSGSGYGTPSMVWSSGAYTWELARSKITGVDQNGDGKSELAALYDVGWDNTRLWLFDPSGSGYSAPRNVWESGSGNWDWSRSQVAAVDQNGDGRTELAVFYDYGGENTALFILDPSGSGYSAPRLAWTSGPGNWDWSRSDVAAVDQNGDGRTELAVFYDYGNANTGMFILDPSGTGYATPRSVWVSGAGNWDPSRSRLAAADQNGDGRTELSVFYDYGYANVGLFIFDPSGSGYGAARRVWLSGAGNWDISHSKKSSTDQNGDGRTELTDFYNYGNANTGLFIFDPSGSGYDAARRVWLSGAGNWDWYRSKPLP
ncbi:MAG: FG-GAP-like repeat-containing protein, partial [Actinomycetota bacterium]